MKPGYVWKGAVGHQPLCASGRLGVASPPQPWKREHWVATAGPLRLAAQIPGEGRSSGGSRAPSPRLAVPVCLIFFRRAVAKALSFAPRALLPRSTETGRFCFQRLSSVRAWPRNVPSRPTLAAQKRSFRKLPYCEDGFGCVLANMPSRGETRPPGRHLALPGAILPCESTPMYVHRAGLHRTHRAGREVSGGGRNAIAMERGVTRRGEFAPRCRAAALRSLSCTSWPGDNGLTFRIRERESCCK